MTGRLRASVIPGLLALTALALTACASQGTIGVSASGGNALPGGTSPPTTAGSSTPVPSTSGGAPSSVDTGAPTGGDTNSAAPSTPAGGSSPNAESSAALASSIKNLNDTWTDPGCKTALAGFSTYLFAQQTGVLQGVAALPGAIQQVRAGASQTKKPQAAVAMNRMVNDMTTMQNQAKQGQTPTQGALKSDFQTMGTVCSQQP